MLIRVLKWEQSGIGGGVRGSFYLCDGVLMGRGFYLYRTDKVFLWAVFRVFG